MKCSICGSEEHSSINCFSEVQETTPEESPTPVDTKTEIDPLFGDLGKSSSTIICRHCGGKHKSVDCTSRIYIKKTKILGDKKKTRFDDNLADLLNNKYLTKNEFYKY